MWKKRRQAIFEPFETTQKKSTTGAQAKGAGIGGKELKAVVAQSTEELAKSFSGRLKAHAEKMKNAASAEYCLCIYFADEAQRQEFVRLIGAEKKQIGPYLNGQQVADLLGIQLEKKTLSIPKNFKAHKKFADLSL